MRDRSVAEPRWLTTADAAKRLDLTPRGVRWLARQQRLVSERTASGQWLFPREEIRRVLLARAEDRAQSRSAALRAVRCRMVRAHLEPRQLSMLPRLERTLVEAATGERSLPDAEVKG